MDDYTNLNDLKRSIERNCLTPPVPYVRDRLYSVIDIMWMVHPHSYIAIARLDACLYELSITNCVPYTFVGTDANDVPLYKYNREAA